MALRFFPVLVRDFPGRRPADDFFSLNCKFLVEKAEKMRSKNKDYFKRQTIKRRKSSPRALPSSGFYDFIPGLVVIKVSAIKFVKSSEISAFSLVWWFPRSSADNISLYLNSQSFSVWIFFILQQYCNEFLVFQMASEMGRRRIKDVTRRVQLRWLSIRMFTLSYRQRAISHALVASRHISAVSHSLAHEMRQ
jgi:hypothetical protein